MADPTQRVIDAGVARATIHGLTARYLGGQLARVVDSPAGFLELAESAVDTPASRWIPRETTPPAGP